MRIPAPLTIEEVEQRIAEIATSNCVSCRTPLDPGIIPLVAGLMRWGVRTLWSCEGHKSHELPYVSFDKSHAARALYLAFEWMEQPHARYEWGAAQPILRTNQPQAEGEGHAFWFFDLRPMRPVGSNSTVNLKSAQKDALAFGLYLLQRQPKLYG